MSVENKLDQLNEESFGRAVDTSNRLKEEVHRWIVGQDETVEQVLWCLFAGGHSLLEGIPGLGKTMLIRTIGEVLDLTFSRIQFTPDLMPSDITGTHIIGPNQDFLLRKGPVFGNLVLADEINRATPKTQSALLEAMQEKSVTIGGETHLLPKPFFVMATQNPLEMDGTYPLPEAQTDRFLLKIDVEYPSEEELTEIVRRTTSGESVQIEKVADGNTVLEINRLSQQILVSDHVLSYAVRIVMKTQPHQEGTNEYVRQYVRYGSGPRGVQSIISTAKVRALLSGRYHVSIGDIKKVAYPALRHRLLLSFEGEAEGISPDDVIQRLLEEEIPAEGS